MNIIKTEDLTKIYSVATVAFISLFTVLALSRLNSVEF